MLKKTLLIGALAMSAMSFGQEMAMPTTPAEIKKMEHMVGEWTGKMVWTAPGMEGSMESKMTFKIEGMFMHAMGTHSMEGMDYTENMWMGWDDKKKEYVSYTFTNFANLPRVEHCKMDGAKMISISDPWNMEGQDTVSRSTITFPAANKFHMVLEFKMGDKWQQMATMDLTKK